MLLLRNSLPRGTGGTAGGRQANHRLCPPRLGAGADAGSPDRPEQTANSRPFRRSIISSRWPSAWAAGQFPNSLSWPRSTPTKTRPMPSGGEWPCPIRAGRAAQCRRSIRAGEALAARALLGTGATNCHRVRPRGARPLRSRGASRSGTTGRRCRPSARQELREEDVRFGITKAIIRRSRLLVSTDSGPRHLAAALGTPTITLFGPIDPRWSENYQPGAIQLRLALECSPCGRRVCPLKHHRCMR